MELHQQLSQALAKAIDSAFQATIATSPQLTEHPVMADEECIISSIGFMGSLDGSFSICLPYSSAQKIVSRMLQMEIDQVNDDVIDGIGEQINMIAGGVKMELVKFNQDFEISIPTTIKGNRMVILSDFTTTSMITLNYDFEGIIFSVSLIYKEHKDQKEKEAAKQQAQAEAVSRLNQMVGNKGETNS